MEKQTLYRFNEWWLTGIVRSELTGKFKRENYKEIMERIEDRQVLLLMALVGKICEHIGFRHLKRIAVITKKK